MRYPRALSSAQVDRYCQSVCRRLLPEAATTARFGADLAAVATGTLPQPLSYLINDTARGHGRIRVAPAACVIHGEEPALLTELAAHCRLSKLSVRQLAPTVLVSRSPLEKTLAALRAEGCAPIAESADGTVRIERPRSHRATTPVPPPRSAAVRPGPYDHRTDVRRADRASRPTRGRPARRSRPRPTTTAFPDLDLDPPYPYAWCQLRDDERVFTLSRIHGVMPT